MSELENKARERIAELQQEIEKLRHFLVVSEQARLLLEMPSTGMRPSTMLAAMGAAKPAAFGNSAPPSADETTRKRVTDNPKPAVLIPAVIEILREQGRPMSRRQLHDALSDRGLVVRGTEPTKTLGTILWRARDVIDSIEGRGYWPKGDPVPRAFSLDDDLKDLLG